MNINDSSNFRDLDHHAAFQRVVYFQEYIRRSDPISIKNEFIRISQMSFRLEFTEPEDTFFDYDNMTLWDYDNYGNPFQVEFEPGLNINQVFVQIPCNYDDRHRGVCCKIIDHLTGIGCLDCARDYGIGYLNS